VSLLPAEGFLNRVYPLSFTGDVRTSFALGANAMTHFALGVWAASLALAFATTAQGASIGSDCKPSGLINIAKEVAYPTAFWKKVLVQIDEEVAGAVQAYRLSVVERENDKIRNALTEREMCVIGITPQQNPDLERALADADRMIAQTDRTLLKDTQHWAERCRIYARQNLRGP